MHIMDFAWGCIAGFAAGCFYSSWLIRRNVRKHSDRLDKLAEGTELGRRKP